MFMYVLCFADEGVMSKFGKMSMKLVSADNMEEDEGSPHLQMDESVAKEWVKKLTMSELSTMLMMVAQEMMCHSEQMKEV